MITFILVSPFAFAVGAWLGRWAQKKVWRYDLPYEQRVKLLRD
jgi:hypothetical protein